MTAEYSAALSKHNAACKAFSVVQAAYRSRAIGDNQFCAAQKAFAVATEEFDIAFAKEAELEEATVADVVNDYQLALI